MIDLTGRNTLRYGPVRDPIKSVVECGVGDDVDTVIVDGRIVMENGVIAGVDFTRLRKEAQAAAEQIWRRWRIGTRSAAPTSRPARGPIRPPSDKTGLAYCGASILACSTTSFQRGISAATCR